MGLELSGDPRCGDFADFEAVFDSARKEGFKVSLHCGELREQTDSQKMIEFRPDRLGHCCYLTTEQL